MATPLRSGDGLFAHPRVNSLYMMCHSCMYDGLCGLVQIYVCYLRPVSNSSPVRSMGGACSPFLMEPYNARMHACMHHF